MDLRRGPRRPARDRRVPLSRLLRLHADDLGLSAKHGWAWPCKHSAALPTFRRSSGDSAPILPDLRVGTGVIVIQNMNAQVGDLSPLAIGGLVFFDRDTEDGPRLDHVGMYLGLDEGGTIASSPVERLIMDRPLETRVVVRFSTAPAIMRGVFAPPGGFELRREASR